MKFPKLTSSFLSNLFTVSLAIYALASLASESTGILGQGMSAALTLLLGNAAYLIPLLMLILMLKEWWVSKYYTHILASLQWSRWVGSMLLIGSLAALTSMQSQEGIISGGIIGLWLHQFLSNWIGTVGALLVINFGVFLGLGLCFDFSWGRLLEQTTLTFLKRFEHRAPSPFIRWVRSANDVSKEKPADEIQDQLETEAVFTEAKPSITQRPVQPPLHAPSSYQRKVIQLPSKQSLLASTELDAPKPDQIDALVGSTPLSASLETESSELQSFAKVQKPQQKETLHQSQPDVLDEDSPDPMEVAKQTRFKNLVRPQPKSIEGQMNFSKLLPPIELLSEQKDTGKGYTDDELADMGERLQMSLQHFNIEVAVEAIQPGPVITLFEVQPAPGVKVSQISSLAKDLARAMAVQSVRVVEVIKGKSVIGLEIPNKEREMVGFREVVNSKDFQESTSVTTMVLGKDSSGAPMVVNLEKMPHLLVAGTTGSGKSVGVNGMIISMLYKASPEDLKFIMIDPKMLELSIYEGIPHLLTPVVTDVSNAANALKWSVAEMERRYKLMSLLGVRNIRGLNDKIKAAKQAGTPIKDPLYKPKAAYGHELADSLPELEPMSFIVIVIDEFADLIMVVGKQVEELIARLAQKARAAGIHLVLATQRPSVNVITGLIKANIPTRLSFQVSTKIDSRTILDQGGAEQLLGMGDLLYLSPGGGMPVRAHGAFVSDEEVHSVVDFVKQAHEAPSYIGNLSEETEQMGGVPGLPGEKRDSDQEGDELYRQAVEVVMRTGKPSISRVQRELRIGYNRAARLIEDMEKDGILSGVNNNGQREILQASPSTILD